MKTSAGASDKRRNREAEVVGAAVDIFSDKGYAGASIQEVADRVGMLKGGLYYYIESKEDLLWRIVDDVHTQSTEILEEVEALEVPAIERIQTYIDRHVEWYLSNVKEVTVYFREWRHLTGDRLKEARRRRQGYDRTIRNLITAAQEAGDVDEAVDPKYASFYVLAAVNSVPDWYRERGADNRRGIAEQYGELTVGLLTGTRSRVDIG